MKIFNGIQYAVVNSRDEVVRTVGGYAVYKNILHANNKAIRGYGKWRVVEMLGFKEMEEIDDSEDIS